MERLSLLLDPALRRMGVRGRVRLLQLDLTLTELLGARLAPLCRVVELTGHTLVIATAHTALAHQLQLDSPRLLDALNARLGEERLQRLRFVPMGTNSRR